MDTTTIRKPFNYLLNAVLTPSSSLFMRSAHEQGAGPVTVGLKNKLRLLVRPTMPVSTALDEALRAEIEGKSYFYPRENIVPDSPDKSGSSNK